MNIRILLLIPLALILGNLSRAAAQHSWPPLPSSGFISGRPATVKDVSDGNAIFVAKSGDNVIGMPIPVTIPQYAYLTSEQGKQVPVIVVQAEDSRGHKIFGVRDLAGKEYVVTDRELQLLGTKAAD